MDDLNCLDDIVTIVSFFPEPNECAPSSLVDVTHQNHLLRFLLKILLIDAELINSKHRCHFGVPDMAQSET